MIRQGRHEAKTHQRQRDPATPGRHVLSPLRRVAQRQLCPRQPGAGATEHHGQIARADDVDPDGMRGSMAVADGAQFRPARLLNRNQLTPATSAIER